MFLFFQVNVTEKYLAPLGSLRSVLHGILSIRYLKEKKKEKKIFPEVQVVQLDSLQDL